MSTSITIARNEHGDDEAHLSGCQHLTRRAWRASQRWQTFRGETLQDAIRAADDDMAANFGQAVYDPDPSDQPWTVAIMLAPCLRKAARAAGLRFDPETGEPRVQS